MLLARWIFMRTRDFVKEVAICVYSEVRRQGIGLLIRPPRIQKKVKRNQKSTRIKAVKQ